MIFDAKTETRFWNKVEKQDADDCWNWKAGQSKNGYGIFYDGVRTRVASRAIFESVNRCSILPKYDCGHKCDNRLCVNPNHLMLQTRSENMFQAAGMGRCSRLAESNYNSILSADQVISIRKRLRWGERAKDLAAEFRVHDRTIRDIAHRHTWRQL